MSDKTVTRTEKPINRDRPARSGRLHDMNERRIKRVILFTAKTVLLPVFALAVIFASMAESLLGFKKLLKEWYE